MSDINAVQAFTLGGKFCECGGLMQIKDKNALLMSDPPKQTVYCPLCGNEDFVIYPYEVKVHFRKV